MKVALIVAMDLERGIGKNNDLMWHLPADMKFFKETTTNHVVVMGRKNYESIPEKYRPLPNRENVVLTRNEVYIAPNCLVFNSLEDCISHYSTKNEDKIVFIIGGGEIYKMALETSVLDEMYITHVAKKYDADTFFPEIDSTIWKSESILTFEKDEKNEASFEIKKYTKF
ncbi:MAG: dihydrofolate reductase [Flavobacteriia bacterium]|nr:dihydrofolate reductase [Flavobacteriia bacterium]